MNSLYLLAAAGFLLLTAVFAFLLFHLLQKGIQQSNWPEERKKKVQSRLLLFLVLWFVLISFTSILGINSNFELFPFNILPLMVIPLIAVIILLFSKGTTEVLQHIPSKSILQLQVFRVFVEILLWMLFIQNLLPVQMTFEGRNWDILTGLTAPLAAYFIRTNKKALIVWNLAGLALLINIVTIAILSMPTPFRVFDNEPANTIVARFPIIFLPGFLVPLAYTLHFLSLKQLFMRKE